MSVEMAPQEAIGLKAVVPISHGRTVYVEMTPREIAGLKANLFDAARIVQHLCGVPLATLARYIRLARVAALEPITARLAR